MNQISTIQNNQKQLELLSAQREIYTVAKNWYLGQLLGNLLVPIILTAISLFVPNFAIYTAFYGLCFFVLDTLFIEPIITKKKSKAAKIQELFDCEVLELLKSPFKNADDIQVEEILEHYNKHEKVATNIQKIKDWYPKELNQLPIAIARLVCQRTNLWWDSEMRLAYCNYLKLISVLIIIAVIAVGILVSLKLEQIVLILGGLLPLFRFTIKQYLDNKDSTDKIVKILSFFSKTWEKVKNNEIEDKELEDASRRIQDEIYDSRTKSPLIPDFFYKLHRNKKESLMSVSAEKFINEIEMTRPDLLTQQDNSKQLS